MDRLIREINDNSGSAGAPPAMRNMHIRYGTLGEYFAAVWAEARTGGPLAYVRRDGAAPAGPAGAAGAGLAAAGAAGAGLAAAGAASGGAAGGKEQQSRALAPISFPVLAADRMVDGGVDFFPYADNANSW
jgi:hypothetical protein